MADKPHGGLQDLTDAQRLALRRAVRNGEYHLLLGAGASAESISPLGSLLPNSSKLIDQLCGEFGVIVEEGDLLWRIYDRAVEVAGERRVYSWFRERFWGVQHPYWMEYYARTPWASVWTLNVDDTFESAHRAIAHESSRQIEVLNWDDNFRQSRKLNVVHLHGVVDTDEPRRLIFSLPEYAGSAATQAAWKTIFHDSYGNSPFVIIGARVRDEPDIETVVSRRHPTHSAPSFYVSKTISPALRMDLTRWGLVPVEMTAEDFVLEWAELTGLNLEHDLGEERELSLRMGHQFIEVEDVEGIALREAGKHDLLGGDEPVWSDIENGLAAELQWVMQAKDDCRQIGRSISNAAVIAYTGRRLTGRSTGLLLVGKFLKENSWRVLMFRHEGRIDIDALLSYAADGKSIALLFDGASDVSDDIDRLVTDARLCGAMIVCVVVDESSREASIVGRIKGANLAHGRVGSINGRLTRVDAGRIVDVLDRVGRLGILEKERDRSRLAHFQGHDLFDAMAQLENAPGFGQRVGSLIGAIKSSRAKMELLIISAYASRLNRRLLAIDAARMIGIQSDQLVRDIQDDPQLFSLLATDGTDVRTRHRWLALEPVVEHLGGQEASLVVRDAVRNVSSRLNQMSLRERNPTALLVGGFMSQRNLSEVFPGADLDSWYNSLADVFGSWSARYWEQRAILARKGSRSDVNLLAKAESFALRATELVPDTYSFTTLGTVLLEKAARVPFDPKIYYKRGVDAFERAAELDRNSANIVTWSAFLRYTIGVCERVVSDRNYGGDVDVLGSFWDDLRGDWTRIYAQIRLLGDVGEEVERDLISLRRQFDSLPDRLEADNG